MSSQKLLYGISLLALTGSACQLNDDAPDPSTRSLVEVRSTAIEVAGKTSPEVAAAEYATRQLADRGLLDEWKVLSSRIGHDQRRHVRLAQLHAGVPVIGAEVVVHLNDEKVLGISGNVVSDLAGVNVTPKMSAAAATQGAKAAYLARVPRKTEVLTYSKEATRLVILPGEGKAAPRLAWHVQFRTELQGGMAPGQWISLYDAETGELIKEGNGVARLSQASGPGGNAKVSRTWTNQLDVEPLSTYYLMDTSRLRTFDGVSIATGPLSPFGDAAINDAHGFAEITLDMMRDEQGFNSYDNAGAVIKSNAHALAYTGPYSPPVPFDGSYVFYDTIQYGDGVSDFYPASGDINVVSHEIHHLFTNYYVGFDYLLGSWESLSIAESFSDIAGEVAEAYHTNAAPDFDVAPDVMVSAPALRYMCNPTADGVSIDDVNDFIPEGNPNPTYPHHGSGIMNKVFCEAARRFGSNSPTGAATKESVLHASRAWYLAAETIWTSSVTFGQACQSILDSAVALGFTNAEHEHLRQAWLSVGVACGAPMKHHAIFRDSSGHVHELYNDGTAWISDNDLTPSGTASAASDPFGYNVGIEQHIVYRRSNDHIFELYNNGSAWSTNDLTGTGIGTALPPMGYSNGVEQHILFLGTDGRLRELYENGIGSGWLNRDLNTLASSTHYPAGKPFGVAREGKQFIVFRDSSNTIFEFAYDGASWTVTDLTTATSAPPAGSDPVIYLLGKKRYVVYKDGSDNVHRMQFDGAAWSSDIDFSTTFPGLPPVVGSPFGFASGATQHIIYRNGTNVHELFNNGGAWTHNNLIPTPGAPSTPGTASDPTGYYSGYFHINFRSSLTALTRQLFSTGSSPWANVSILSAAPVAGAVMGYNSL